MEKEKGKRKLRSTTVKKPVAASVFLVVGLDLEEQQCVLIFLLYLRLL